MGLHTSRHTRKNSSFSTQDKCIVLLGLEALPYASHLHYATRSIYEPQPDGSLQLIGADYLVFSEAWNAKNDSPPELMGQLFHLFEAPNRFGLPAFYTLHVWAWKHSPTGPFVNWHANVSC